MTTASPRCSFTTPAEGKISGSLRQDRRGRGQRSPRSWTSANWFAPTATPRYTQKFAFQGSQVVWRHAVNMDIAGSIPAPGATRPQLSGRAPPRHGGGPGPIPGERTTSRSSSWPGERPLTPTTRVRLPHAIRLVSVVSADRTPVYGTGDPGSIPGRDTTSRSARGRS